MTVTILIYIVLLIIFLIISGLIFRHTVKFGYLAPRFAYVVGIFGIAAVAIVIFSVYLLFALGGEPKSVDYFDSGSIPTTSSGDLNF